MHTPPAPCQEPGRTCCACTPYQDLAISIVKLAVNLLLQFYQNLIFMQIKLFYQNILQLILLSDLLFKLCLLAHSTTCKVALRCRKQH